MGSLSLLSRPFLADERSAVPPPFDPGAAKQSITSTPPPLPTRLEPSSLLQIVSNTLNRRERCQGWERVRNGLKMMYVGLILGAGSFLVVVLVNIGEILALDLNGPRMAANPHGFVATPNALVLAEFGLAAGIVLGTFMYMTGACLCFSTPDSRAGLWLVAQQLALFLAIALAIGMCATDADTAARPLLLLCTLAAAGCLAGYLQKLARVSRQPLRDENERALRPLSTGLAADLVHLAENGRGSCGRIQGSAVRRRRPAQRHPGNVAAAAGRDRRGWRRVFARLDHEDAACDVGVHFLAA